MKRTNANRYILLAAFAIVALSVLATNALAQSGGNSQAVQDQQQDESNQRMQRLRQVAANNKAAIGLEGYCPVCIINSQNWIAGKANHSATYDGKTYFFPEDGPRQEFLRSPAKYVPALGGDCTVCYEKAGKRMPGNIRSALLHNNRLYLFPGAKEREAFKQAPQEFENTDLAINGNCIVCQVKMNKIVPGDAEYTAVHDGFRYQFPSDRERQTFVDSPQQYVAAIAKPQMKDTSQTLGEKMSQPNATQNVATSRQIQVSGKTACAGCEFGVKPIGAPNELGLAVTTRDGNVYVIEDGHSRWPEVYRMRFKGQPVAVSGTIIKTAGNISWIKPSSLTAL